MGTKTKTKKTKTKKTIKYSEWQDGSILPVLSGSYERRLNPVYGECGGDLNPGTYDCVIQRWHYGKTESAYQSLDSEWQWRGRLD